MGIPAYFSYIIKNHSIIIQSKCHVPVSALFIDSNSIVYDVVYSEPLITDDEIIIEKVIEKIKHYVSLIRPSQYTYIAFDGIAPVAKMNQQRKRRYKSAFLSQYTTKKTVFNTVVITPGTPFMNRLADSVEKTFSQLTNFVVSTSKEFGEGEHKLCDYIKRYPLPNENIVIYGLDADLIMLSIFHLSYVGNIYVCREARDVSSSQSSSLREMDYCNIQELTKRITIEMNCIDTTYSRVNDYILMCFLLGNDFLPAFPSLNLRTAGIGRLMETYREHIGKYPNRQFVCEGMIQWKWLNVFFIELAKNERTFFIQEYSVRDKMEKTTMKILSQKRASLEEWMDNTPILFREIEHYISPEHEGWENRYYQSLQLVDIKDVCINYLEGLEWVYTYYTKGCVNTQWKYNYHYPPLFIDLIQMTSTIKKDTKMIKENHTVITEKEQLEFIIPPVYWKECGMREIDFVESPLKFKWAFKRYFWEAEL